MPHVAIVVGPCDTPLGENDCFARATRMRPCESAYLCAAATFARIASAHTTISRVMGSTRSPDRSVASFQIFLHELQHVCTVEPEDASRPSAVVVTTEGRHSGHH